MLTLGPFAVARDGRLTPREPGLRPALRFDWRGRRCEAEWQGDRLRLRAIAGRIPSTAEPGANRRMVFEAAARLPQELPEGWRLRLTPDHRLAVEAEAPTRETAVELLGEMVRFALALDPWIERIEQAGVRA
ncbi:MAG: hypothetical protein ACK44F_05495 [Roseococcus sp.]|jgi:hypothetical protein